MMGSRTMIMANTLPLPPLEMPAVALVDIGTFKTVCMILIADGRAPCGWRVAGVGHQVSRGVKARMVMQAEEAEEVLRAALMQAERMAGIAVDCAIVAYGGGRLTARDVAVPVRGGQVVDQSMLQAAIARAEFDAAALGQVVLCVDDNIDAGAGAAWFRVQETDEGPLKTIMHVVERADLAVVGVVPAALASALAVSTKAERAEGTMVLDIGAGATTAALFEAGHLASIVSVPVGGNHMTFDIARELQIPVNEAERIKLKCGMMRDAQSFVRAAFDSSAPSPSFDSERNHAGVFLDNSRYSTDPSDDNLQARVQAVVAERASSLLRLVADRTDGRIMRARQIIVAGGVAQLQGFEALAASLFGVPVRMGRPSDPCGMFVDSLMVPAFAVAVGVGAGFGGGHCGRWHAPGHHGSKSFRDKPDVRAGQWPDAQTSLRGFAR